MKIPNSSKLSYKKKGRPKIVKECNWLDPCKYKNWNEDIVLIGAPGLYRSGNYKWYEDGNKAYSDPCSTSFHNNRDKRKDNHRGDSLQWGHRIVNEKTFNALELIRYEYGRLSSKQEFDYQNYLKYKTLFLSKKFAFIFASKKKS